MHYHFGVWLFLYIFIVFLIPTSAPSLQRTPGHTCMVIKNSSRFATIILYILFSFVIMRVCLPREGEKYTLFACLIAEWMTFRYLDVARGHYLHSPWALPMVGMGRLRREGTQRSELLGSGASTFRSSGAWSGWWDSASRASSERMLQLSEGQWRNPLHRSWVQRWKVQGVQETHEGRSKSKGPKTVS